MIDGTITAESERKQIQALLKPKKQASTPTPKPKPLTAFEELHLEVMRLHPDSVRPIEDAPPTAPSEANHGSPKPYVADTRTPDEIIGEMPAWMRRAKPSPSIAPEALQELIDAGIDPDEAAERLQEQIERWS